MYKVLTFNKDIFLKHCLELQNSVSQSFSPDLIIGISSGGEYVANQMFPDIPHINILLQRPGTKYKDKHSFLLRIIRNSPLWLRDFIRVCEAGLTIKSRTISSTEKVVFQEDALSGKKNILVVDDAIDSGKTLYSVVSELKKRARNARILTAVITTTTSNPLLQADYTLYNNHTLIRFPWSKDFKEDK